MTIRELKKIVDLVTAYKADYIGSVEPLFVDKTLPKLTFFYKLLKEDKIKTEDDAAYLLLDTTPFSIEYQELKKEFIKRLITAVFFIDSDKSNKSMLGRTTVRTAKNTAAARILINHGAHNVGISLLQDTFESTNRLQRNEWNFMILQLLSTYSAFYNKPDDFANYSYELLSFYKIYEYELRSEMYKQELTLAFVISESEKYKHKNKAERYYRQLRKWCGKIDSFPLLFNTIEVGIYLGYIRMNYNFIIELANERDNFMKQNLQFKSQIYFAKDAVVRMEAYIYLREYEKGREEAKNCINFFHSGTTDWLAFLEFYFVLCMHMENLHQAINIYYQVLKDDSYPDLNIEYKERWKYFEPYLNYILPDQFLKENFDLLGFLDEISYYKHHKSDNNIVVMIGQIIIMIDMGEFQRLEERTPYLETYINKHVNVKIYPRTKIFLTMVLKLFKNNFNAIKTEKQTAKQFYKLRAEKENKLYNTEPLEIIPFDRLWPSLLQRLKDKYPEKSKITKSVK